MKLLHTADLHLDSAMDSRLPEEKARLRRRELLLTFSRIADLARSEGVDAVLISGDLFDTPHPSPSAVRYVLDTVASHPDIDFLLLYGNHAGDFRFEETEQTLPENLRFFGREEFTVFRYGNVSVYGCESNAAPLPELDPEERNIVMLHGQVSELGRGEGEIALSRLRNAHIDYLALGHLHALRAERLDERGIWCYAGTPEGRGFDEAGEKNVVLLSDKGDRLSRTKLTVATRTIHIFDADISSCTSQRGIEDVVLACAKEAKKDDIVRIRLTGKRPLQLIPDRLQLLRLGSDRFFYAEVVDESQIAIAPEEYELDPSLRGEFVRTVLGLGLPKEEESLILTAGLAALNGEEVPF